MTKTFGRIISDARKKLGISQKDLASKIVKDGKSISPQYLNDVEWDRRNPPSEEITKQLASELQIPVEYLILAAGNIPQDFEALTRDAKPEMVAQAFRAFRRTLKKG